MNHQTIVQVILYKSKQLSSGEYPLMLRLTRNRKRKYLSFHLSCPENLWDINKNSPKKNHPYRRELETKISLITSQYRDKVMELEAIGKDYSLDRLVELVEKRSRPITVKDYFDTIIQRLIAEGKIGNANSFKNAKRPFVAFTRDKDILITDIDEKMLLQFESYLRKKKLAETSMAVYFRALRSLMGKAIQDGIMPESMNPFKTFKVSKFDLSTRKRAITKEDIHKIINLKISPEESLLYDSRNYFLFSYLGQGINFIDIALLRWKDIVNDRVNYVRSKTGKPINFKLLPQAQEILNYYHEFTGSDKENYVFPILTKGKHDTAVQINNRIHKILTKVNNSLKEIGKKAKVDTPITTYVARHSYATVLKHSGASITIIKEAMGHASEEITETYLKSFENGEIDEANLKLL